MAKLLMVLAGLWLGISFFLFMTARMNNHPVIVEEILSQSFYYAAIAFAVYHFATRNKRPRGRNRFNEEAANTSLQGNGGIDGNIDEHANGNVSGSTLSDGNTLSNAQEVNGGMYSDNQEDQQDGSTPMGKS